MRNFILFFSLGIGILLLVSGGFLRNPLGPGESVQGVQAEQRQTPPAALSGLQMREAKQLLGENLRGVNDEVLGEIDDLVLDMKTGQVRYLVVSSDDAAGSERYVVPWNALQVDPATMQLALAMPAEQFKTAPRLQDLATQEEAANIQRFYGVAPNWSWEVPEPPSPEAE